MDYISARSHYTKSCNLAYREYLSKSAQNVQSDLHSCWDFVNAKRKSWKRLSCMAYKGRVSQNDKESCEFFASFFKSVYSTDKSTLVDYPINNSAYDVSMPMIDPKTLGFHPSF